MNIGVQNCQTILFAMSRHGFSCLIIQKWGPSALLEEQMIPMASTIKVLLERRCLTAFRSPVFDTTHQQFSLKRKTPSLTVTMAVEGTSFYVQPEGRSMNKEHRDANKAIQDYVQAVYGVTVCQKHIDNVREMCRRELAGEPPKKPYRAAPKTQYVKEALQHLKLSP